MYQAAIAEGKTVSLTYVKLLALGPGQVGKSTFLYRLLGLMEGNIEDTPKESHPQRSTGQSKLREVCIKYSNMVATAAPDLNWELCGLQSLVEGLIRLVFNQTQDNDQQSTEIVTSSSFNKISIVSKEVMPDHTAKSTMEDESRMSQIQENTDRSSLKTDIQEQQNAKSASAKKRVSNTSCGPEPSTDSRVVSTSPPIKASNVADLISNTISEYENICIDCKNSLNVTELHMLFNIADVGGQPAFLDMFPSLTIGPALYLLFIKLLNDNGHVLSIDDLSKLQPVQYCTKDDTEPQNCESYTYTLEEIIFCALSSIACFGLSDEEVEKYVSKESKAQRTSSLAMLFGTFVDKINEDGREKLVETESNFWSHLKRTDFYSNHMISLPEPSPDHFVGQVFFRVNNKTGRRQEIDTYRKIIQELVEQRFKKYNIPASWLGLSICLKILAMKKETCEVSFEDCAKLGKHFRLNKEEVKIALKFLHKYIGLVMYFPNDKNLQNLVICNPQVVFSSISELTFSVYDSSSRGKQFVAVNAKQKRFEQTGIFNPLEVSYPDKSDKIMSIHDLVHLLVHLNIAAKITTFTEEAYHLPQAVIGEPAQSNENEGRSLVANQLQSTAKLDEYFLPAVLKTADTSSLVCNVNEVNTEILPEPLCIRFDTGYMPMGFTCALSARLMADGKFCLAPEERTLYKNKLKLRYDKQFNITMISLPLRCEFRITRHYGSKEFHQQDCCPKIMKIIRANVEYVLKSMQRTMLSKVSYNFAFKCPNHPESKFGYEPLAKLVRTDDIKPHLECLDCQTKIDDMGREMKIWFGEVRIWLINTAIC